jgi:hypothetical protein
MRFKHKYGFLVRDFVVVGLLFGLVIAMFIIQVASLANNYNNQDMIDPSFSSHYSKLQDNLNKLDTSFSATKGTGGLNLIGTFNVAFNSVFTVITMAWDGILIYTGMASNIGSDFKFFDHSTMILFLTGIIAVLTSYLIFIWLSSVSRGKI